jgi:hypothetical protein
VSCPCNRRAAARGLYVYCIRGFHTFRFEELGPQLGPQLDLKLRHAPTSFFPFGRAILLPERKKSKVRDRVGAKLGIKLESNWAPSWNV